MDHVQKHNTCRNNDIWKIWFGPVLFTISALPGETGEIHKNLGQDHQPLNQKVLGKCLGAKAAMKHKNIQVLYENLTM